MKSAAEHAGMDRVAGQPQAQAVLAGIVARCEDRGSMSRAQREFATTCLTMLREDDPLRPKLQGWIDMRSAGVAA